MKHDAGTSVQINGCRFRKEEQNMAYDCAWEGV